MNDNTQMPVMQNEHHLAGYDMKTEVISRLVLCLGSYLVIFDAFFLPGSTPSTLTMIGDIYAYMSLFVLGLCASLCLWDTVMNDVLNLIKTSKCRLSRNRHMVWMILGITYLGYVVILFKNGAGVMTALPTLGMGLACASVGVMDTVIKFKSQIRKL